MKNKTAFITGGSWGIGFATAHIFLEKGSSVVIASRDEKKGRDAEVKLRKLSPNIYWYKCDVTIEEDVKKAIYFTLEKFGSLDFAFNNGGSGFIETPLHEMKLSDWEACINGFLTGTFLCMKIEIDSMIKNDTQGVIVNNASVAGLRGFACRSAYSAAKHGVIGLTKSTALEYAGHNIRINAIAPGWVETPPIKAEIDKDPKFLEMIKGYQILGRAGKAEEVANTVMWLCSDEAAFITGNVLPVDGGFMAK